MGGIEEGYKVGLSSVGGNKKGVVDGKKETRERERRRAVLGGREGNEMDK